MKTDILLLDDDIEVTRTIALGLKSSGFHVDAFNDPFRALSGFTNGSYELVISDAQMPRMSGFEFIKKVVSINSEIKVIILTSFEIKKWEFQKVLPSIKVDALVNKPIGMTKLSDTVKALLTSLRNEQRLGITN